MIKFNLMCYCSQLKKIMESQEQQTYFFYVKTSFKLKLMMHDLHIQQLYCTATLRYFV
jgi:hypothetical protein